MVLQKQAICGDQDIFIIEAGMRAAGDSGVSVLLAQRAMPKRQGDEVRNVGEVSES